MAVPAVRRRAVRDHLVQSPVERSRQVRKQILDSLEQGDEGVFSPVRVQEQPRHGQKQASHARPSRPPSDNAAPTATSPTASVHVDLKCIFRFCSINVQFLNKRCTSPLVAHFCLHLGYEMPGFHGIRFYG